jgi:Zn-dependent protease with chaperone function
MSRIQRTSASLPAILALVISLPLAAQTKVTAPKNKYTPAQDVQVGQEAAAEVRQQLPLLRDGRVDNLVESVGRRLVDAIPSEFRHPEFRYSFEVVNQREINAFALPGGPMFLHRGMIEAAKTDGEVAGVMAHELSHVALRHGTAQATKSQPWAIGSVLGQIAGAVIGGNAGAVLQQGAQIVPGLKMLQYGRDYERQADVLGAQIMARAGYDPRQMANMFQTIARQGGNRGPEWLSSHPDPGNRYAAINKEAQSLQIAGRADTADEFEDARSRLAQMSPAPTAEQIAQNQQRGRTTGTSGRRTVVEPPSSRWHTDQPSDFLRVSVPSNWDKMGDRSSITYAPDGGYEQGSFTHGVQIGTTPANGNLQQTTETLIRGFAQANPNLRRQGGYTRTDVGGRQGLTTTLRNVSETTGDEGINLSTVQLRDGTVLYIIGVAPVSEWNAYVNTFARVRQMIEINDR